MQFRAVPEDVLAQDAAEHVVVAGIEAITARGVFFVAFSGGRTPGPIFDELARATRLNWAHTHIYQVDERADAPEGGAERNSTLLTGRLLDHISIPSANVHLIGTGATPARAAEYEGTLPDRFDLVHLGLGADGHTASLVPGDPILADHASRVGVTGCYEGHRRITLTRPTFDAARALLFVVAGTAKARALAELRAAEGQSPAVLVARGNQNSTVLTSLI